VSLPPTAANVHNDVALTTLLAAAAAAAAACVAVVVQRRRRRRAQFRGLRKEVKKIN